MRIIDQTDKIVRKLAHGEGKPPSKQSLIPGLIKISKPKKKPQPQRAASKARVAPPAPKATQPPPLVTPRTDYTPTPPPPSTTNVLQAELTAFMQPLAPLMDWELPDFDLDDAMALDTQWLEGLSFATSPSSPNTARKNSPLGASANGDQIEPRDVHNEFRLACHYCTHMTSFYSVKDPHWNFYTAVNEEFAYRYSPLRHAILAWSSLHLAGVEKEQNRDTAMKHYQLALKGLMCEDFTTSQVPLEILLVGSYFLCVFDLMSGENHLTAILRHVWTSLRMGALLESNRMSPFSNQILTWMIYLDVRASLFVGNIQFPNYLEIDSSKGKGRQAAQPMQQTDSEKRNNEDVQYLLSSDLYEKRVVADIFGHSRSVLQASFGTRYPVSSARDDDHQDRILVVMVKNMLMFATLIRLRNWLSECGNSLEFHPQTLLSKIEELKMETEAVFQDSEQDSRVSRFHVLIELALVNAVIIYFDRLCNPDTRTSPQCQEAASKIVEIAKMLKRIRAPGTPGSLQWPFPLVIAGIETTDPKQQSWVLDELEENEVEGWGVGVKKTREIVMETVRRQNEHGRRVDLGETMMGMGDLVII